ncbi:acyl-CoA dehydrogenase family protein [Fibrisoma montanum]|uniref:Acyl-CoA dehydrogenase family protein n=1 Tax=Fibrisoma montanum TaxID=2305895 RepID=A0A418LZ53_9BACT|nr:acyl-CoA dehydrogenase family protein [Fibrisoma montanum]RIV18501.1 acyl-CoA dehydrogenase family protein [Fibrisoma montanum]
MISQSVKRITSTIQSADSQQVNTLINQLMALASQSDSEGAFPEEAFGQMAEAGMLGITLPGQPLDFDLPETKNLLQLLKRIGTGNLAVGRVYEGHINALYLIHLFGNQEQKKRYGADVRQHQRLFSVWNTQADDGIRIHALGGGRYVLEGSKTFCSGAGWIQRPLVTGELVGQDRSGWQMCIIPTERVKPIPSDEQFWQPLGMRASASFKLDFTGVELEEQDLLGQPGDYFKQPYFSGGAIRFAAVQLGAAEALLSETRTYLNDLNRVDDPFQKARIGEMTYLIESGNQWLNAAGDKTDVWLTQDDSADKIVAYANMTRTAIEQICLRTMELAERSVGARGLLRPLPFERIHRDLSMYLRQPAPDAALTGIGHYVFHTSSPTHDLWR